GRARRRGGRHPGSDNQAGQERAHGHDAPGGLAGRHRAVGPEGKTMKWIKHYTDLDGHPQVQRAGFWAARVFELLCRVCGQYELGGVLPPQYLHADWLARRRMLVDVMPAAEAEALIAQSIERLCDPDVGLLERLPDGSVRIDGWERLQGSTSAERMRRLRARRQAAETCDGKTVAGSDVTVTSRDVTVTSRDATVTSRASPVTHVTLK